MVHWQDAEGSYEISLLNAPTSSDRLRAQHLRTLNAFQPLAVVMGNVPDVMNHGNQDIAEQIREELEAKGYVSATCC
jgi:site-specific DNA-cytosine methylase